MIKLSEHQYVAASEIAEVSLNPATGITTVRLKNGVGFPLFAEDGRARETLAKVIAQIDAEVLK